MPPEKKAEPERTLHGGHKIRISMHGGKIVKTIIKAQIYYWAPIGLLFYLFDLSRKTLQRRGFRFFFNREQEPSV